MINFMVGFDFLLRYSPMIKFSICKCLRERRIKALKNFLKVELQHYLRNPYVKGYPYMLTFETGNLCQLECPLCPVGRGKESLPQGFLKFENFKKLIGEIGEYLVIVFLYNWGEPLLNKDIFKMAQLARKNGIFTIMSTNLNRFNDKICEKLIVSGPDMLLVSLDGASQETVEKYQRGNNYLEVMGNIESILEAKRDLGKERPILQWRFLVNKYNEHDIPKAKRIASRLGINLELGTLACDMGRMLFLDPYEQFENIKSWLPLNEKHSLYNYKEQKRKNIPENDCSFLWRHSIVNWDGSVFPCCWVYDSEFSFGNAFERNFEDIWNNENYISARSLFNGGDRNNKNALTICDICYDNQAMVK